MKYLKRGILALLVGVLLEVLYFNFSTLAIRLNPEIITKSYSLSQMEPVNWVKTGNTLVSGLDPMLQISGVDCFAKTLTIQFNTDSSVESVTIFYTNDQNDIFNGNAMLVRTGTISGLCMFDANVNVKDLRVDLGDMAGTVLNEATVIVNDDSFDFSISRVVAVVLIYFAAVFLFSIQKMPDYHLEKITYKGNENDGK